FRELLGPKGFVLRAFDAAEMNLLGAGVFTESHAGIEIPWTSSNACVVKAAQFIEQNIRGPAVAYDVMGSDHQDVVLGLPADQLGANQWTVGKIERRMSVVPQQGCKLRTCLFRKQQGQIDERHVDNK